MPKKLAIDWDETELRLVAANCQSGSVKVTDAAVIDVAGGNMIDTLGEAIARRGLEKTPTLVVIGRGKAELRELQLPPVPDDELPDMVRFQAIRSFASAGDSATVDFLVTKRGSAGVELIAAAVGPAGLDEVRRACEAAELDMRRIALRPLAAAALYLNRPGAAATDGDTVLIDLLANDAEIVVAREGSVIFVRTVRMPADDSIRAQALAGELKRSLVACGSSGSLDRVVLWGRAAVHSSDRALLEQAVRCPVETLDPFDLVDVDRRAREALPEHVGRLAPLVGLLAADETAPDHLVDFLNPRQRVEHQPSPYGKLVLTGLPVAAVILIGLWAYRTLNNLDQQISQLRHTNAGLETEVERATQSIQRTELIDSYLDGNINWLSEVKRLAETMPPSEEMIVRRLAGAADDRQGGGTLTVVGGVTRPDVIDSFARAVRDPTHRVFGDGASEQDTADAYRWGFTAAITVASEAVRQARYAALVTPDESEVAAPQAPQPAGDSSVSESRPTESTGAPAKTTTEDAT